MWISADDHVDSTMWISADDHVDSTMWISTDDHVDSTILLCGYPLMTMWILLFYYVDIH